MNKFTFLVLLLMLCSANDGVAQMLGMNMSMFQAQGEFNTNVDHDPIGLSFTYSHDLNGRSPWSVGGELGIAMYSNKKYEALDNSGNQVTVFEEDCFWNLHGYAQYKLIERPLFELYAEGRTGFSTFFSEKHAEEEDADLDAEMKTHGMAFNMGAGGGVLVNLSGLVEGDGNVYRAVWMDASLTANSGTRTNYRYATEDTKLLDEANYRSLTNYTHFRIGIAYRFDE